MKHKFKEGRETFPINMKRYEVIYADPPWRYEHPVSNSRKIENQYPTMELEEIKKLQVPSAENSVLFLWATAPKLQEALEVMLSWGFTYRSCLVWDKEIIGMGYWFRNRHELLLVGIKGKFSPPKATERISSVVRFKREKHSQKPKYIRRMIGNWYSNNSKLEMFARERMEGWDCFGNEVPETIQKVLT